MKMVSTVNSRLFYPDNVDVTYNKSKNRSSQQPPSDFLDRCTGLSELPVQFMHIVPITIPHLR